MENSRAMEQLVDSHRMFLAFLQKRVESREVAEDILQSAFVRGLQRETELRDGENAVAWFYRILRNAVIDHYRARGADSRALETWGREFAESTTPPFPLRAEICACLGKLVETLKPEYRQAVQLVDLEERPLRDLGAQAGITDANAAVRVHRARAALKTALIQCCGTCAEHGCSECECSH